MLGGGAWVVQNKTLPGTYTRFVTASQASSILSDRGICAIAMNLDWGSDEGIFKVEAEDFIKNSKKIFGYDYANASLRDIREIFLNAKTLYCYRLNSGVKASNTYCEAKYSGVRGNDIKTVITKDVDDETAFIVDTYLDTLCMDTQTVKSASELVDNDYVVWKKDAELAETVGLVLSGGTNAESVDASKHQDFLDKAESYSFNILGCASIVDTVKALYVAYTKRMVEEVGKKFQLVVHKVDNADYEGVISVANDVLDEGVDASSIVYWVVGAEAGCAVNKSCANKEYDGEYTVDVDYTQSELTQALKDGKFIFHNNNGIVCVLRDINSFTSFTVDKGESISLNQVIRVLYQHDNDIATLYNTRFVGKVNNNASGRIYFWNEVKRYLKELEMIGALQNVDEYEVVVGQGEQKEGVTLDDVLDIPAAMEKLYITTIIQ